MFLYYIVVLWIYPCHTTCLAAKILLLFFSWSPEQLFIKWISLHYCLYRTWLNLTMEYNLIVDFLPDMSLFSGCFLEPYRLFSYYYCISYPFSVLVFVHCVPITLYFVSWIMRLVLFQPPADFPETDLQLVAYYSILCILCFACSGCWLCFIL